MDSEEIRGHVGSTRKPDPVQVSSLTVFFLCRSDADSDVLADYVLALLRHDQPVEEVRKLCIDQLEDFLKDRMLHQTSIFSISKGYAADGHVP